MTNAVHTKFSLQFWPWKLVVLSFLFFIFSFFLLKPSPQKRTDYLPPPEIVKYINAGLRVQMADSFWLRAIQDFDYCTDVKTDQTCVGQSWLFQILNLTTELDSYFLEAYYYGGLALAVIISDYPGATKIFDKGVAEFPTEWPLLYAAGYHALFEEKNKVKAAKLYLAAAENGAPAWVRVLAGRLAFEGGEKEYAAKILEQMIATSQDSKLIDRLKQKLMQVQK